MWFFHNAFLHLLGAFGVLGAFGGVLGGGLGHGSSRRGVWLVTCEGEVLSLLYPSRCSRKSGNYHTSKWADV